MTKREEPFEPDASVHQRADARRNVARIIDTATELLSSDPTASMADVAKASGVVRATLYRHFPSREELIKAILRKALDSAEDAIAAADLERGPAPDAVARLIDALIGVGTRFRIVIDSPVHDPEIMERGALVGAPVLALAERGQSEGTLRDDVTAAWLTAAVAALITESVRAMGRGEMSREEATAAVITTFLEPVRLRSGSGTRQKRAA